MSRWILAPAVIAALVFAGLAFAHVSGTRTTKSVSASFAATAVIDAKTTTCAGADGTYAVTHATYRGTATSAEPRLNGPIEIRAHSVVNTMTNLGWLDATLQAQNADARISGVLANGHLQGLAAGRLHAPQPAQLLANLSATYSATAGFGSGQLGAGAATNSAIATAGSCSRGAKHEDQQKPHKQHKD